MQFSVGDKVVHPHRGPGRVVDVERRAFLEGAKQYYAIEIPAFETTVYVPVRRAADVGVRPAMSEAKVTRVLDTLRSSPHQLPLDYKERQERIWEKIRDGRPIWTAEAVRDLAWRKEIAYLTKKDAELLRRGQELLAAEMALVSDIEPSEAEEQIESALAEGRHRQAARQLLLAPPLQDARGRIEPGEAQLPR